MIVKKKKMKNINIFNYKLLFNYLSNLLIYYIFIMIINNILFNSKIIKYMIYGLFIFTILYYIPQTKLCLTDTIFITIILLYFIYFFEHFNNRLNKNKYNIIKSNDKILEKFTEDTFDNNIIDTKNDIKLINKYNYDGIITKEIINDVIIDLENSNKNKDILEKLQDMSNKDNKFKSLITVIETNMNRVKNLNNDNPQKIIDLVNDVYNRSIKTQDQKLTKYFESNIKENESKTERISNDCEAKIEKYLDRLFKEGKYFDKNGLLQNVMNNDMRYSQLTDTQMQPLGSNDMTMNNSWENDYVLLNTDKWKVPQSSPYKCKQEKECPICPSLTNGYPVNVKDFNNARKIMPPDNINIDYIKDKLNSGLA